MALSNTATPKYYGLFRDAVRRGEIPVNREISMEMNRIDALIKDRYIYYDEFAMEGFVLYSEAEMTLTDGSDLHLLDTFKLWAEQVFCWYYFVEDPVWVAGENGRPGAFINKRVKKRLTQKQYLIVARGAAKSMYASLLQSYFLNVDVTTTHQASRRGTISFQNCYYSSKRTIIQIPYRRFIAKHDWFKSQSC